MTKHPYISERVIDCSAYGRENRIDRDFMNATFTRDLAKALDATTDATDERFAIGRIDCGDGLEISVHTMHGAKLGRVEIFAGSSINGLDYGDRPSMPSATFDTSRPIEAIAKAVRKNIIDVARPLVEGMRVKAAARADAAVEFGRLIEKMRQEFPTATIGRKADRDLTADVYLNVTGGYATGTLYADGRISFQRVSASTVAASSAILRAIVEG